MSKINKFLQKSAIFSQKNGKAALWSNLIPDWRGVRENLFCF